MFAASSRLRFHGLCRRWQCSFGRQPRTSVDFFRSIPAPVDVLRARVRTASSGELLLRHIAISTARSGWICAWRIDWIYQMIRNEPHLALILLFILFSDLPEHLSWNAHIGRGPRRDGACLWPHTRGMLRQVSRKPRKAKRPLENAIGAVRPKGIRACVSCSAQSP
jgi:hypothetical protein